MCETLPHLHIICNSTKNIFNLTDNLTRLRLTTTLIQRTTFP